MDVRMTIAGTLGKGLRTPGLESSQASAAWLWNNHVAAIAADNPALEALEVQPGSVFLHRLLIPLLGMPVGELWDMKPLAEECARLARYEFFLVSAPLMISGGVGTPANAYALF
jgi:kynurenine formamidase